ncbi:MAG: AMP-binding protein, partial [Pseudomonadota bacterium]
MSVVAETLSSAKVIARDIVPLMYKMAVKPPAPDAIDNLPLRLANTASQCPNKIGIIFEGRSITWGELDQRASKVAQALRARGIGFGDTVSLMMDNLVVSDVRGVSVAGTIRLDLCVKQTGVCTSQSFALRGDVPDRKRGRLTLDVAHPD